MLAIDGQSDGKGASDVEALSLLKAQYASGFECISVLKLHVNVAGK